MGAAARAGGAVARGRSRVPRVQRRAVFAGARRRRRARARPQRLRAPSHVLAGRRARPPRRDWASHSEERDGSLWLADPDGRSIQLLPHRPAASEVDRWPQHARPSSSVHVGGPRRLGHVNCLTGALQENTAFYTDALGMKVSDWLGDAGVWFHIDSEHHVMALVDVGLRPLPPSRLRRRGHREDARPARPSRPARTVGVLGADPSRDRGEHRHLRADHRGAVPRRALLRHGAARRRPRARTFPDDRYSSNTWGPLPPRSYFRFDEVAVEFERESWETRGRVLPPAEGAA